MNHHKFTNLFAFQTNSGIKYQDFYDFTKFANDTHCNLQIFNDSNTINNGNVIHDNLKQLSQ